MNNKLKYIKRKDLNASKYDACVASAINTQVYAFSWYLDAVADSWGALVLDDYEVVMPVPFLKLKRHLFAKKIYQPDFCQQLGVFSRLAISPEAFSLLFEKFISLNPKYYNFNYFDSKEYLVANKELSDRDNYELQLFSTYENLISKYSKNLRRNIAKAKKQNLRITDSVSVAHFISLKKSETTYQTASKQYVKKSRLFNVLFRKELGKVYGVFMDDELIAASFVIHYKNRFIMLSSTTTEKGKKIGAVSFLFDELIRKNANSKTIFDFEGSMLPGVARFFGSFGADKITYKSLSN